MKPEQQSFEFAETLYLKSEIVRNSFALITMHKKGVLGGEVMPEDARPGEIELESADNYHFLTLPMALNYQRNSYKLWEAAANTYRDSLTRSVFNPNEVSKMDEQELRALLLKHKVALQPQKHINTWMRICNCLVKYYSGDIRNLLKQAGYDIINIRKVVQESLKKEFPYLSGHKIFNYWLHVLENYTPTQFINRQEISVAPDTHIIQASVRLGLVSQSLDELAANREIVANAWKDALQSTDILPIDLHTPMWLWSRKGFPPIIY